jgi:type IV pilus assembly protein PilP
MAKRKLSVAKKIIFVGLFLIVVQAIILLILNKGEAFSPMEAIDNEISKLTGASHRRKEEIRLQLVINDFRSKHQGQAPKALAELVPTYYQTVPIDPETGKPFAYRLENGRPLVGDPAIVKTVDTKGQKRKAPEIDKSVSDEEQQLLIASLSDQPDEAAFVYDPTGKRDPFRPFNLTSKSDNDQNKTPLERYDLGQLKVTAILTFGEEPRAVIENNAGVGFSASKGTKIGPNGGEIIEILQDRIVILETSVDFTGEKRTEKIEMRIRTKDQEELSQGIVQKTFGSSSDR